MMTWFKRALAFAFGVVFSLLMTAFIAHAANESAADSGEIIVDPMDDQYPAEWFEKHSGFQVAKKKKAPWYHQAYTEKDRILRVSGLNEQAKSWSELEKDMFLDRVDRKGAAKASAQYPKLPLKALQAAEKEIRVVKARVHSMTETK